MCSINKKEKGHKRVYRQIVFCSSKQSNLIEYHTSTTTTTTAHVWLGSDLITLPLSPTFLIGSSIILYSIKLSKVLVYFLFFHNISRGVISVVL